MRSWIGTVALLGILGVATSRADALPIQFESTSGTAWSKNTLASPSGYTLLIDTRKGDSLLAPSGPTLIGVEGTLDIEASIPPFGLHVVAGAETLGATFVGGPIIQVPVGATTIDYTEAWQVISSDVRGFPKGAPLTLSVHVFDIVRLEQGQILNGNASGSLVVASAGGGPVPEPATTVLFLAGLAALARRSKRAP